MIANANNKNYTGFKTKEEQLFEKNGRAIARLAASEGIVLLKNKNDILPLQKNTKISLYGPGATQTVKGGTGSGDVNERHSVTIYEGLKNDYEIVNEEWLHTYNQIYNDAREQWKKKILAASTDDEISFFRAYSRSVFKLPIGQKINKIKVANEEADTAIYVLSRISGEGADRHAVEDDYYLSLEEKNFIKDICEIYKSVILIINTGGIIDLSFVDEFNNIDAILYCSQMGMEGGNAIQDIISGNVTPQGKLTDTWANKYEDYPNSSEFSNNNGNAEVEKYGEGIYVGYRYFDSFEIPVRYPFGYGLSYTSFQIKVKSVKLVKEKVPEVVLQVEVKNIGKKYSGREVLELYVMLPQTGMRKEMKRFVGFKKTKKLSPGESQIFSISFSVNYLSSYNEKYAQWIIEEGCYGICVGNAMENLQIEGIVSVKETIVTKQLKNICLLREELKELQPDLSRMIKRYNQWVNEAQKNNVVQMELSSEDVITEVISYEVRNEHIKPEAVDIVNKLSKDQMKYLVVGNFNENAEVNLVGSAGQTVPGSAGETSLRFKEVPWKLPNIIMADGPAGLRLNQSYTVQEDGSIEQKGFKASLNGGYFLSEEDNHGENKYYQYCTAIPVGTLLAQTFDPELLEEVGKVIGKEMELFNINLWLAPGMNIHRNPLCGRNYEYYSEDPLLSGEMAAAITRGVQSCKGRGTTIKHLACNNHEDCRMTSNSIVSERTLREIYLKGFEVAVIKSNPKAIMTSYNKINGIYAANNYDLCSEVIRKEWGFQGILLTDWLTTSAISKSLCTAVGCIRAGNDLTMPGLPTDIESIDNGLAIGDITINELRSCCLRIINTILIFNEGENEDVCL